MTQVLVQPFPTVKKLIEKSFREESHARLYFQLRSAIYGKFVKLTDHDYLWGKGMVRFLTNSNELAFEERPIADNTRIYVIKDFQAIKLFKDA